MFLQHVKTIAQRVSHRVKYDPSDIIPAAGRFARFVTRRAAVHAENKKLDKAGGYIEHFGVHMPRSNAGDTVLFDAVERLFDQELGPFNWRLTQLRRIVTADDLGRINRSAKAVLVGGGGLFIADTNANAESGWQWKISLADLKRLKPPLILFAVGYNQFRGAEAFGSMFDEHLRETVRKSVFVGVRNSGSIKGVKAHLPPELQEKVIYQPCMTTTMKYYYPSAQLERADSKDIAVNLAFDRRQKRFGDREAHVLGEIATALRHAIAAGYRLHAAVHAWDDDPMVEFFRRKEIPVRIRRLNLDAPEAIVRFYSEMPLTIGMRGHAQMIPFGCGNAIFSIISHDKMRYFLDDIGHPEWGADVNDPDLCAKMVAFIDQFQRTQAVIRASIDAKQRELWAITQHNLQTIGAHLVD